MGMVFLELAMRGEQKLHAKPTACCSKVLDGAGEKLTAGQTVLPSSLLTPLGYLEPFPIPSLPQGTSTTVPPSPAYH